MAKQAGVSTRGKKKPARAAAAAKPAKKTQAKAKNGLKANLAAATAKKAKRAQTAGTGSLEAGPAVLDRLFGVIMDRRTADPAFSHSARLLSRGTAKVAQKFGEEAVECLIEAVAGNREALVAESADVLYHLLVMWASVGVRPDEVWAELRRREGVSGVTEKAARAVLIGTKKIP